MADGAVEFLLNNLKELLLYHLDLIDNVKDQIQYLYNELRLMKAFLHDSREKRNESEYVREVVRQITLVTYEAEDIIDEYVANAMQKSGTLNKFRNVFNSNHLKVAKKIDNIRVKVKEIYEEKKFGIVSLPEGEPSRKRVREKRPPTVEEHNVVGFDEEAKVIFNRLMKGSEKLEVVSIIGMGGLGKTTLARKVYTDPSIRYHFYLHAWTYVSQKYSRREVFLAILESIDKGKVMDPMHKMSDEGLANVLYERLKNNRYLIVIDDVWTKDAWDDIKMAFPDNETRSRILLTSRNREVALHANLDGPPHSLKFLSDDESWELLRRKTFPKTTFPPELENLGIEIAKKCYGLPLAIVVVAGLLFKKEKTREWWTKVAESVSTYVARDPTQCMDVLALSYYHLPDHLKTCFIYFGVFPEDFEIPIWKLLRLWVAEGFVQESEQEDLEDIAEEYLEDLVDRNLVLVEKKRTDGRIKTCRIHDMLRDLCVKEGKAQNFLQVIKGHVQNHSFVSPIQSVPRRICVHSNVLEFIASKPSGPQIRSFLSFSSEEKDVPRQHTAFMHEPFELVRVLDLKSIIFPRFPNDMVRLVHLRFLYLFGNFKVLPGSISNLWNLQTIIIGTTNRDLEIKADIWKMLQLRHFYSTGISTLYGPPAKTRKDYEDPFVRRNILTISTISPDCCTENILARTPSLRKLGIRGKLVTLMDKKGGWIMFDNIAKLDKLKTLKLLNDTFPSDPSQCKIPGLPQPYQFPPNLKKLTLSDTCLDWAHMQTLGMLPNLEILKLKDNAFSGTHWEPLDGGFRFLRILQLGRTDLVQWNASGHHFPRLQSLVLTHCSNLEAIPSGLAEVPEFQRMELNWMEPAATISATKIQERKQDLLKKGLVNSEFKLLIYPRDS